VLTVILEVVSPVDHWLPEGEDEVRTTDPPEQNERGPEAEMVGMDGVFTVTTWLAVPVQLEVVPVTV